MKAFNIISKYNNRVSVHNDGGDKNIWVLAGQKEDGRAAILVSCFKSTQQQVKIGLENYNIKPKDCKVYILDVMHNLQLVDNAQTSGNEIILEKQEGSAVFVIELL
jgi:hypothetical protein